MEEQYKTLNLSNYTKELKTDFKKPHTGSIIYFVEQPLPRAVIEGIIAAGFHVQILSFTDFSIEVSLTQN